MALTFFWNAEAADFSADNAFDPPYTGTCYSAGDDTASLVNSATISATAARVGSNGVLRPASTSGGAQFAPAGIFPGNIADPSTSVGSVAFSVYFVDALRATDGVDIFRFIGSNANNIIAVQTLTTANIRLRMGQNGGTTTTINLAGGNVGVNQWLGVVLRWDVPNDLLKLELYDAAGDLLDEVSSSSDLSGSYPLEINSSSGGCQFASYSSLHAYAAYFDNFFVANTYDEPLQNNLTISSYQNYSAATKYLKMLVHPDAIGATGVEGVVWAASTDSPGARVGAEIGEFSGGSFTDGGGSPQTDPGYAVLKVAVDDFGGSALTTSDTPIAVARTSTYTTGLVSCTVVEE